MSKHYMPMDQNAIIDEIEELKIKLAMALYAGYDGEQLQKENEALKTDPFYQPSETAKKHFKKRIGEKYYSEKVSRFFLNSLRGLNKAAAIFAIIFILFSTSVLVVGAVRVKVLNLFISMQEKYTEIRIAPNEDSLIGNNIFISWDSAYAPTKIPEGYTIQSLTNGKNFKAIEYTNKDQETIHFQQLNEDWNMNVDTEDANKTTKVSIQGQEGLLVEKNEVITVVWGNQSDVFTIISHSKTLGSKELIRMAESVNLIK